MIAVAVVAEIAAEGYDTASAAVGSSSIRTDHYFAMTDWAAIGRTILKLLFSENCFCRASESGIRPFFFFFHSQGRLPQPNNPAQHTAVETRWRSLRHYRVMPDHGSMMV